MSEPIFTKQAPAADASKHWVREAVVEGRAAGATFFRASEDPERNLVLVEGWKARPDDQGEPRFR
jgi:hypothetical protein